MTVQEAVDRAAGLINSGDLKQAQSVYEQVLQADPGQAGIWHLMGLLRVRAGDTAGAAILFRQAVALEAANMVYHYTLGVALMSLKQYDDALVSFRRAASLPAPDIQMRAKLARAFFHCGQQSESIAMCKAALAEYPNEPDALEVLSNSLLCVGEFGPALEASRRAAAARPDYPLVHWNFANLLLLHGQYAEGWREFEWRKFFFDRKSHQRFAARRWDGTPLLDGTLLVYSEGGFGDTLQYIRYIPLLSGKSGRLILECRKSLIPLAASISGIDQIIPEGDPLPAFDQHISLPSLPGLFHTDSESIPDRTPYLTVPQDRLATWSPRVPSDGILNVGLCWRGNRRKITDRRGDSLEVFSPLARIPGVRFFSLQIGDVHSQPRPGGLDLIDLTNDIRDFADTAALISQLDLVISVDTSVAHLAGALARPTWLLVPYIPDYRWLLNRSDSPWYPSMRLFRQSIIDDWTMPLANIAEALDSFRNT